MANKEYMETLNYIAQRFRGNDLAFGGIQMILVGDFLQLPPVSNESTAHFWFESTIWAELQFKVIYLTEGQRQRDPITFKHFNAVRLGLFDETLEPAMQSLIIRENESTEGFVSIFPRRAEAKAFNARKLDALSGEIVSYISDDTGSNELLDNATLAEKELQLKVGATVMLIQNLNSSLVNGSIGIVIELTPNSVKVAFEDQQIALEKTTFTPPVDPSLKAKDKRVQIPLILAYGLTIHKCQGLTIDKVIVDMENCFEDGQFYVAISRATCLDNVRLLNYNPQSIKTSQKAKDFYDSLLQ